jgi:hypothetical protein
MTMLNPNFRLLVNTIGLIIVFYIMTIISEYFFYLLIGIAAYWFYNNANTPSDQSKL